MSNIEKVTGSECLQYIDNEIGLVDRSSPYTSNATVNYHAYGDSAYGASVTVYPPEVPTTARIWRHNTERRKIGLVLNEFEDGGFHIAILGNEEITPQNTKFFCVGCICATVGAKYSPDLITGVNYIRQDDIPLLPNYAMNVPPDSGEVVCYEYYTGRYNNYIPYDEIFDYKPTIVDGVDMPADLTDPYRRSCRQNDQQVSGYYYTLHDSVQYTLQFGAYSQNVPGNKISGFYQNNPLYGCNGSLWDVGVNIYQMALPLMPLEFQTIRDLDDWDECGWYDCATTNHLAVPYNLILTRDASQAQAYLQNGTLPNDAFLFPMDWDDLPWYTEPDDDGDGEDDNTPDDTDFSGDPNPPVAPVYTPSMLSNYNWYWLQVGQFKNFINWFWNDVGDINDWSDLMGKIEGLYNNLASAILMCRYYPVDSARLGGTTTANSIIVGMVEKADTVEVLNQATPPQVYNIGRQKIPTKYNSFVDLAPYSQLSLYLPFYGFVDLDINIFSGRYLDVKAVYDYMSGTIQYFLYCDDKFLVNSYLAKLAVDIPLTLQTKNDRDSAIFSNVSNALSGLVGAGVTMASGNPLGLLVGAGAMNSGVSSSPMRVCGTVGETGAFYAPPKCALILRRPTISKPTNWARIVGQMCGKDYTLQNLEGKGFTKCYQPRIDFKNSAPLQTEIDEIYDYLEKGVIL